jgi:hypothetical protein
MKIRTLVLALTAVLTPALAMADTVIQARSDVPATVIMDGTVLGQSPLDITKVRHGDHEIRFRALGTGLEQAFNVAVPHNAHGLTPVAAEFGPVLPAPQQVTVVEPAPVIVERPVVYARPAPAVIVSPIVFGRPYHRHHRGYYRW